jgi:hypothetical protein
LGCGEGLTLRPRGPTFALCLLVGALVTTPARAAEAPPELRRTVDRLLTALQKADEKAIVSLLANPQGFGADGGLSQEARAHLFERPQPYARSLGELAKDWGIQSDIRMLRDGSAIALFHTWGTEVETLRDDDYRVSYFVCKFHPTPGGWKMQRLCSD